MSHYKCPNNKWALSLFNLHQGRGGPLAVPSPLVGEGKGEG